MKTIWFDMDGTIANLYEVDNWLDKLIAEDETPYAEAKPLLNMSQLAKELNRLTRQGYAVNIISWLSKGASQAYNEKVSKAKRAWLKKHLKSVQFAQIDIVEYGTPKHINRNGILFDDEQQNRAQWKGRAYEPKEILNQLKKLK